MKRIIISFILIILALSSPIAAIFFCRAINATDNEQFCVALTTIAFLVITIAFALAISNQEFKKL